jgi:putative ABC transport system substrate-binding protein
MQKKLLHTALVPLLLAALLLSACGSKEKDKGSNESKTFTIGVLIQAPSLSGTFDGFKAGMTELGYTEGKNVTYVFDGTTGTIDALKPEAEKLKSLNPDLLLAVGTPPTQTAKEVFTGTAVPILFAPVYNPVDLGLVESFQNPGGNLTGIQSTDTVAKSLEWLLKIVPEVKRIYVPYPSQDTCYFRSDHTRGN